jgi:heme oxygenase
MGRSSTLARLALETSRSHAFIDEALLGPLEFPTTAGYRRFLCMLYGFQAPFENALAQTPNMDAHAEFLQPRWKAARIASDLMSLGLTRHEHCLLARRQTVPAFESVAHAFGFMYATERLMLPIDALRIRLEIEMPVVTTIAHNFIYAYANSEDMRWRQFGTYLDRFARHCDIDLIVASARAGVDSLTAWLSQQIPATRAATNDERPATSKRATA